MRSLRLPCASICLLALTSTVLEAHTILKKPFQDEYHFKSVSCYACHASGRDKDGKRFGKEVLNDFGKAIKKATGDGELNDRINAAKKATKAMRKELHDQITKDFLRDMKQVEQLTAPGGARTWGELLKAGELEGVKKKPVKTD